MTTLDDELSQYRRWRPLRPGRHPAAFQRLLHHEFAPPAELRKWADSEAQRVARWACDQTSFYPNVLRERGLSAADIRGVDDLPKLPILTKWDVQANSDDMTAKQLPADDRLWGVVESSGTTAQPTRVAMSANSNLMFTHLLHRAYRWHRYDPMAVMASIRRGQYLRDATGQPLENGKTYERSTWQYLGKFFHTGKEIGFCRTNPTDAQIDWLRERRPDYLLCMPGIAEEMAFACVDQPPVDSLQAVRAIGGQVTPQMRKRIETTFGVPVHQNYGLNEVGHVAVRCEAGRYHVHVEHCVVEIVDDDGQPCEVGQRGRIVVTALRNPAMPLIRYDTDDTAEVTDGLCPCGRTLPTFGEIAGRLRRYATLPAGTRDRVRAAIDPLQEMPAEHTRHLRRYQVHQSRDNRFELRLLATGPLPNALHKWMHNAWRDRLGSDEPALTITQVDHIAPSPSGKYLDFTSDCHDETAADDPLRASPR